jgi:hypothetical protein
MALEHVQWSALRHQVKGHKDLIQRGDLVYIELHLDNVFEEGSIELEGQD